MALFKTLTLGLNRFARNDVTNRMAQPKSLPGIIALENSGFIS